MDSEGYKRPNYKDCMYSSLGLCEDTGACIEKQQVGGFWSSINLLLVPRWKSCCCKTFTTARESACTSGHHLTSTMLRGKKTQQSKTLSEIENSPATGYFKR